MSDTRLQTLKRVAENAEAAMQATKQPSEVSQQLNAFIPESVKGLPKASQHRLAAYVSQLSTTEQNKVLTK